MLLRTLQYFGFARLVLGRGQRPFMAERVAQPAVAIAPELIGERHGHRRPCSDRRIPDGVGMGEGQMQRHRRAAEAFWRAALAVVVFGEIVGKHERAATGETQGGVHDLGAVGTLVEVDRGGGAVHGKIGDEAAHGAPPGRRDADPHHSPSPPAEKARSHEISPTRPLPIRRGNGIPARAASPLRPGSRLLPTRTFEATIMKVLIGTGNPELGGAVAAALGLAPVEVVIRRLADLELQVEIQENVRGEDVYVVQPTSAPASDRLMELLIIADTLKRGSARRITAVMPYFGYARQDRKTGARTPIAAKLVANLLVASGIDRLLTLDLHAGQIQGFFDIPVDHLEAAPLFAADAQLHWGRHLDGVTIVSPDIGGVVRARRLLGRLGNGDGRKAHDLAIIDKRRPSVGVSK